MAQLIFCEAVTAINLLSKGGNFVFKMFTSFEQQMICLLYLLTSLFQEVNVIKPGKQGVSFIAQLVERAFLWHRRGHGFES